MGTTTFTGPVTAGDVLDTTGTTPGSVRNVGYTVMAQSADVTNVATANTTTIVIPAYSQILSIDVFITAAFATTLQIGDTTSASRYTAAEAVTTGVNSFTPGTIANWVDVGANDSIIKVTAGATGAGEGIVTVTYLQAAGL
jgi:hypothetical protein